MTNQSTPKTDSFRALIKKTGDLHLEVTSVESAIRERDAIRTRIGDCRDETEARKHLAELTRAEETVIIKQARLPRLQNELTDLLAETQDAYGRAHSELSRIIKDTPKQAAQAFRELLLASQLEPEVRKVEQANPIVVDAIRPLALASKQDDLLHEAWRAANITGDSAEKRIVGFQNALKWLDRVLAAHSRVVDEDKRMTAACEAFRKVLNNR